MTLIDMAPLQASARKWPDLFSKPDVQAREAEIEYKMRTVRPVVETGCVVSVSEYASRVARAFERLCLSEHTVALYIANLTGFSCVHYQWQAMAMFSSQGAKLAMSV